MSDVNEWESRYRTGDMPWEKGAPAPGLIDFLAAHPELPRGRVAIPGCGTGHDVRAWAQAGFEAWGYDISPSAIRLCEQATAGSGLPATFQTGNFLADTPQDRFDWLFEHTLFCAINPQQREDYVQAALRWMKPEGQFLAIYYLIPDVEGPPFGATQEEVLDRLSPILNGLPTGFHAHIRTEPGRNGWSGGNAGPNALLLDRPDNGHCCLQAEALALEINRRILLPTVSEDPT